jgi:HlyD family secretion protein
MKTWKKVAIALAVVVVLGIVVAVSVQQSRKGVAEVQTGKVTKQDLASVVTASGEIKPKTYVNVGANGMGRITRLFVKEGDRVKKGAVLATLDNIQSEADVAATRAAVEASRTDLAANQAALKTSIADVSRAKADAERSELDWKRAQQLYKDELIPKADYDTKKATWESSASNLAQSESRVAQAKAQVESASRRINQQEATLRRASDVLSKTVYSAPFDGVITNLPVREGETVVMGIQNAPGSTLMTLADVSVITAELKVDETDIVNVKLGQSAEVAIDAIPKKKFKGHITEIGNNALLRSTGVSTAQTTGGSQEAKDFKVVVTLDEIPENLRPGLSATAKITTATRQSATSIPIQALTIRERGDLKPKEKGKTVKAATPANAEDAKKEKEELQGVFVINNKKAEFREVTTGITGTTDIEVTNGLKEGDEIITGSYKVLRTLRNGASVKINNAAPKKEDEK